MIFTVLIVFIISAILGLIFKIWKGFSLPPTIFFFLTLLYISSILCLGWDSLVFYLEYFHKVFIFEKPGAGEESLVSGQISFLLFYTLTIYWFIAYYLVQKKVSFSIKIEDMVFWISMVLIGYIYAGFLTNPIFFVQEFQKLNNLEGIFTNFHYYFFSILHMAFLGTYLLSFLIYFDSLWFSGDKDVWYKTGIRLFVLVFFWSFFYYIILAPSFGIICITSLMFKEGLANPEKTLRTFFKKLGLPFGEASGMDDPCKRYKQFKDFLCNISDAVKDKKVPMGAKSEIKISANLSKLGLKGGCEYIKEELRKCLKEHGRFE